MNEDDARRHIESGVQQVLDVAAQLKDTEFTMIVAIWLSDDAVRRDAAWANAKAHIGRTNRTQLLAAAGDRLIEWINSSGATYAGVIRGTGIQMGSQRRSEISKPLLDAAVAVIAADGLSDEEKSLLMGPLRTVASRKGLRV